MANPVIAVVTSDEVLQESIVTALREIAGSAIDIRANPAPRDLTQIEAKEWIIIDATQIRSNPEWKQLLAGFSNSLIFYCPPETREILFPGSGTGKIPLFEVGAITGDHLSRKYRSHFERYQQFDLDFRFETPNRIAATDELGSFQPKRPPRLTKELLQFLDHIENSLHGRSVDFANFSLVSSRVEVPESQIALAQPPKEIDSALEILQSFALENEPGRPGFFLIGKSGAGKSTLAAVLAHRLSKGVPGATVRCFTVDFTWAIAGKTVVSILGPMLSEVTRILGREAAESSHWIGNSDLAIKKLVALRDAGKLLLSKEVRSHVLAEHDIAIISAFYEWWKQLNHELSSSTLGRSEFNSHANTTEAFLWYRSRASHDINLLFIELLEFLLEFQSLGLEHYTYRKLLYSIIRETERSLLESFFIKDIAREASASSSLVESLNLLDPGLIWNASLSNTPETLRAVVTRILRCFHQKTDCKVLFIFDNMDQRPTSEIEGSCVLETIRLFMEELRSRHDKIPREKCLICMRGSTYLNWKSQMFMTTSWGEVEVRPPDFAMALHRRCQSWRNRPIVGDGRAHRFVQRIIRSVDQWVEKAARGKADDNVLTVITNRHPFNLRRQLNAFVRCCKSALFHELMNRPNWNEASRGYYVRMFLLAGHLSFVDDFESVPNIFDAGDRASPFNACVSGWILNAIPDNTLINNMHFRREYIHNKFKGSGVPSDLIDSIIDAFLNFNIILRRQGHPTDLEISIWGKYFRAKIAFDMPYVDTVWWDTPMVPGYSIAPPRPLQPSELREYCKKFCNWIEYEERLAIQHLNASYDCRSIIRQHLYVQTQCNLEESLKAIEQHI